MAIKNDQAKAIIRRKGKFPWEEIEYWFIHGEEVRESNGKIIRTQPSIGEVVKKFGIAKSTVSDRANSPDTNGKNWHERREQFFTTYKNEHDTALAVEIAGQEVAFRLTTLQGARLAVQHCMIQLHRTLRVDADGNARSMLSPDALTKLAASLRKAQEIGLVAMDRRADGAQAQGAFDDWTLMRKIRAGVVGAV